MSNGKAAISYAELVDLLRTHLNDGISGLISGISENQHSFQIGFEKGKVISLTYRVFKSAAALDKLLLIEAAKIVEHLGATPPLVQADLPDSSTIMARLAAGKSAVGSASTGLVSTTEPGSAPSSVDSNQDSTAVQTKIDVSQLDAIKRSAVHSFGPFAALMCDEHLTASNLANTDLSTLLMRIAQDLGASNADTKAFIDQIIR